MAQKFVKANGLHNVFSTSSETTLDITSIKPSAQSKVNQNSIVFLTATSGDEQYGYNEGSKYIWTHGELYPTNSYDEIIKEDEEVITNSIIKINENIGLDSSFGLVWSQKSEIEYGTSIKEAIEKNQLSINELLKHNEEITNNIEDIDIISSNVLVNHEDKILEQQKNLNAIDYIVSNVLVNHENDIENIDKITSNILVNHENRLQTIFSDDIILANIIVNYEYRIKELENKIKILEDKI